MNDILEDFIENVCSTCKGECDRGITIVQCSNMKQLKCVDYKKDESKIEKYVRPETRIAEQSKSIMGFKQMY